MWEKMHAYRTDVLDLGTTDRWSYTALHCGAVHRVQDAGPCAHQMPTDLCPPMLPTCDNQKDPCAIFTEGRNCLRYRINMQMMSSWWLTYQNQMLSNLHQFPHVLLLEALQILIVSLINSREPQRQIKCLYLLHTHLNLNVFPFFFPSKF